MRVSEVDRSRFALLLMLPDEAGSRIGDNEENPQGLPLLFITDEDAACGTENSSMFAAVDQRNLECPFRNLERRTPIVIGPGFHESRNTPLFTAFGIGHT